MRNCLDEWGRCSLCFSESRWPCSLFMKNQISSDVRSSISEAEIARIKKMPISDPRLQAWRKQIDAMMARKRRIAIIAVLVGIPLMAIFLLLLFRYSTRI